MSDAPPAPDAPSLADRIAASARGSRRREPHTASAPASRPAADPRGDRRFGIALALLLPAAPIATWGAAAVAERRVEAAAAAIRRDAADRLAAHHAAAQDAAAWSAAGAGRSLAEVANGFARALSGEDRLATLAIDGEGVLTAEVATRDPDALRSALRREPTLADLRDAGQRRGDGTLLVRLRAR